MFKEQYLEEIEWGTINWPKMNKLQIFGYHQLKKCVYREYAKSEQSLKNLPITTSFGLKPKICEILVLYPR
jgi:hypothetical protein